MRLGRAEVDGLQPGSRDAQHFAGFDFAHVLRIQQIECAGFRRHHPGGFAVVPFDPSQSQRPEASRIAHGVEFIRGQHRPANTRLPPDSAHRPARPRDSVACERATRCTITSVSLLVWKMEPRCSSLRRHSLAFVKLPLCATAILPLLQSIMIGWAFNNALSPAVEYRRVADGAAAGKLRQAPAAGRFLLPRPWPCAYTDRGRCWTRFPPTPARDAATRTAPDT